MEKEIIQARQNGPDAKRLERIEVGKLRSYEARREEGSMQTLFRLSKLLNFPASQLLPT
jgi:hypothetical protein